MDIKLFSKCLKEAICDLERVAVPYLGVFQAELIPSSYSDKQTTISPPYRKMSFRKAEVTAEDGRDFMIRVACATKSSYEQALVELDWCLGRLRSELEGNKICILPGLGKMKANSRNDFFFVPDADLDIYPEASGLEPVCIKKFQPLFDTLVGDVPVAEHHGRKRLASWTKRGQQEQPRAEATEPIQSQTEPAQSQTELAQPKTEPETLEVESVQPQLQTEPKETESVRPQAQAEAQTLEKTSAPEAGSVETAKRPRRIWLYALVVFVTIVALVVAASYLFPEQMSDLLDHLLYSEEELRLLGK